MAARAGAPRLSPSSSRQASATWPNPGSETDRTSRSPPSNCSRCWAATPSSSWQRGSISRLINSRKSWRNSFPRRWIMPVPTASSLTRPSARGDGFRRRGSRFPRNRRISAYRTEKPAKFSCGLCPDVTGQRDRPCDIGCPRGFQSAVAAGPWAWPALCVMERALKHKYTVGETVYFTASNVARPAASGTYEVIRLLPTDGDDCQYRIKNSTEAFERVAKESQLDVT